MEYLLNNDNNNNNNNNNDNNSFVFGLSIFNFAIFLFFFCLFQKRMSISACIITILSKFISPSKDEVTVKSERLVLAF